MAYTTINKSLEHFNTKLHTGNGTDGHAITGVGFQPDLIWLKSRSIAEHHIWSDAVRGVDKQIYSNLSYAEATATSRIASFTSDGFTLGAGDLTNKNGETYVSWNFKANGQGSSNTDGSINTTYTSANTTAGFSIVKYTGNGTAGATVGHGLGSAPKMIIVKCTSQSDAWGVYHSGVGAGKYLKLNETSGESTATTVFPTTQTSSIFYLGDSGLVNGNGRTYIAYCFADKTGYSKFGSYIGNGSTDGAFVYTGFKPAFVMVKKYSSTSGWYMNDTARDFNGANGNDASLFANTSGAEFTSASLNVNMLSNGFKLTSANSEVNGNTYTYIYMCFAEAPLVGSNNVPCTAR